MRHTPVCVFGEVLLDCLPDGRQIIGGAPFNVAWHLSAFGETPHLRSAVGEDPEGHRIRDAMADWGMDLSGLQTDPEHPTGLAQVHLEAGEPCYEVLPARAFDHIHQVRGGLRCDLLYHGTLAVRGADSATALAAIKAGGAEQVFLDCNLRSPWWSPGQTRSLVEQADWVKLTRAEFGLVTGLADDLDEQELAARAANFHASHALTGLIVTLGAASALTVTAAAAPLWTRSAAPATQVDPVGVGAALSAVVILGLRYRWPLPATLARAQQFACRIAQQPGATAVDPGLYEPFIEQWGLIPAQSSAPLTVDEAPLPTPPKRRGPGRPRRVV